MKTPSRLHRIVTLVAAISMASVAVAQPPPGGRGGPGGPGGPGGSFGPGPGGPFRGPGRPGPGPLLPGLLAPPPPIHRHYYSSGVGTTTIVRVQRELKSRGYYRGPIDGDAGSGTRAGIRAFREDSGLGSSTRIDSTLLRALGL